MDFRQQKAATLSMAPHNHGTETPLKTATTRHTANLQELEGIKKPSVAELVNKFKCKSEQEPLIISTTTTTSAKPLHNNLQSNNNDSKRSPLATTIVATPAENANHHDVPCPTEVIDTSSATAQLVRPKYSGYGPDTLVIKPLLQDKDNIQLKKGRSTAAAPATTFSETPLAEIDQSFNNNHHHESRQHLKRAEEEEDKGDYGNKYQTSNDEQAASLNSLVLRGFEQETVKRSSTSYDSRLPVPSDDVFIDDQLQDHTNILSSCHDRLSNQDEADDYTSNGHNKTFARQLDKGEEDSNKNSFIKTSNHHQPFSRIQSQQSQSYNNNIMPNNNNTDSSDRRLSNNKTTAANNNNNNNSDRPQPIATLQSMMMAAMRDEELSKNLAHLDMDTMQINHPNHHSRLRHHPMFFDDLDSNSDHIYNDGFLPSTAQDDYYYYGHAGDDDEDYMDQSHFNHHDHIMHHHPDEDDHLIDDIDQIDDNYLDYGLHTIVEEDENSEEEEEEEDDEDDEEVDNISLHHHNDVTHTYNNISKLSEITTKSNTADGSGVRSEAAIDYDLKSATTRQNAKIQMQPVIAQANVTSIQQSFSSPSSSTKSAQSSEEQPTEYQKQRLPLQQIKSDRTPSDSSLNSGGLLMTTPLRMSNSVSLPDISIKTTQMNCVKTNDFNHKHTLRSQSPTSKNPLFLALEQHQLLQNQKQKILVKKMQKKSRRLNGKSKKDETCPQLSSLDLKNLDDKMIDDLMTHVINSSSASSDSSDSSSSMSMDMDDACARITTSDDNGCRIVGIHEDEQHDHLMFSHHQGVLGSLDDLRGSSDEDEELMLVSSSVAAKATDKLHKSCLLTNGNQQRSENRSSRNIHTHQSSNIDSHHYNQEESTNKNNDNNIGISHSGGDLGKTLSLSVTNQNNCQQNQDPLQHSQQQNKQQQDSSLFLMAPSKLEQYFTSGLIKRSSGATISRLSTPDRKQHDDECNESDRDGDEVVDCNDEDTRKVSSPCDTNMSDRQLSLSDRQNTVNRVLGPVTINNLQTPPDRSVGGVQLASSPNNASPSSSSSLIQIQIESLMKQMLKTIQENSKIIKTAEQKNIVDDKVSSSNSSSLQDFEYNMRQLAQLIAASQSLHNSQHHITNSPLNSINSINLESTQNKQHPNQRAQSATSTSTSNNSDYGSDTQSSSADCLLQANDDEGLLAIIPPHHDQAYPSPPNSSSNISNLSQNHRQNRLQQHQQQQQQHNCSRKLMNTSTVSPIASRQPSLAATSTEQMPRPPPISAASASQQQFQQHSSAPVAIELCQKMIESFKKLTEQQDTTVSVPKNTIGEYATKSDVALSSPGVREKTSELMISNDRSSSEKAPAINSKLEQQQVTTVSSLDEMANPEGEEQKAIQNQQHHYNQERQLIRDEAYEYLKNQINNIMDTIQLQPNLSSLQEHNTESSSSNYNNLEVDVVGEKSIDNAATDESGHDNSSHEEIIMNEQSRQDKSRPSIQNVSGQDCEVEARSSNQVIDKTDGNMIMTDSESNQLIQDERSKDEDQTDDRRVDSKMTVQPHPQPRNKHKTRISYNQSPSPVTNGSPSKPGPVVVTIGGSTNSSNQCRSNIISVVNSEFSSQNSANNNNKTSSKTASGLNPLSSPSLSTPITDSSTSHLVLSAIATATTTTTDKASPITSSPMSRSVYNREHGLSKVDIGGDNSLLGSGKPDANYQDRSKIELPSKKLSLSKEVQQQHPEKPRRTTKTLINVTSPNNTAASDNNGSGGGNNSISAINTSPLTATVRVESPLSMPTANLNNSNNKNSFDNNNSQVKLDHHHHQCVSQTTLNNDGHPESYSIDRSSLVGDHGDKSNAITEENDNQDHHFEDSASSINSVQADQQADLHHDQQKRHLKQLQQQQQQQQLKQHETNNSITSKSNISSSTANQQQQVKRKSSFYRPGSPVPSQLSLDLSSTTDKTAPPTSTSATMLRNFTMGALSPRVATSSSTSKIKQSSANDNDEGMNGSTTVIAAVAAGKNKEALNKSVSATTAATTSSITDNAKQQQQLAMSRSAAKALALAQKYNYSPSLLVAGKLGDNIANNNNSGNSGGVGGKRGANQLSPLQPGNNNPCPELNSLLNGAQLANNAASNGGSLRRQANQNTGNTIQGPIRVTGEVCFSISFQAKTNSMDVHVVECRDLAPVDKKRQRSNPYIKLYLLPDRSKSGKRKSAIKKADLNPKFDETFTFSQLSLRDLEQRTLWLSVWHKDRLGRNDFLGEIILPLDLSATQTLLQTKREHKWYKLQERFETNSVKRNANQASQFNGELFVALKFVPLDADCRIDGDSDGDLHIIVKEAHNIRAFNRQIGLPNPYCKCQIITSRGHRLDKQKSPILKRTINPKWNHKFIFNQLLFGQLKELCIELSVWDRDSLVSNEFLGGVRLCSSSFSQAHFGGANQKQQSCNNSNDQLPLDRDGTIDRRGNTIQRHNQHHQDASNQQQDANERPNQLWHQMLARPNMWVYGELRLRRGKLNQSATNASSKLTTTTTTNYLDQSTQDNNSQLSASGGPLEDNNNTYLNRTNTIVSRSSTECTTTDDRESINSGSNIATTAGLDSSNCDSRLEHHSDHH